MSESRAGRDTDAPEPVGQQRRGGRGLVEVDVVPGRVEHRERGPGGVLDPRPRVALIIAYIAGGIMLILSILGLLHSRRTTPQEELFGGRPVKQPSGS